tara:strand:+ start:1104 stop:1565 length:462 start_codon:yes stop_codon:yes gene_type:complete
MNINKSIKKKDLKFGFKNEKIVLNILNNQFKKIKIKHYKYIYHTLDFYYKNEDNKKIIEFELKSRNINHNQYKSIIFGKNKFIYSCKRLNKNIRQIYLFYCLDGLYYWELKDKDLQINEYYESRICNKKRNDKFDDGINIKVEYLKPIICLTI